MRCILILVFLTGCYQIDPVKVSIQCNVTNDVIDKGLASCLDNLAKSNKELFDERASTIFWREKNSEIEIQNNELKRGYCEKKTEVYTTGSVE